jgi:hypothetical protein
MAKKASFATKTVFDSIKKRTSIGGHSKRSKPLNKHKRRSWSKYRGQGRTR